MNGRTNETLPSDACFIAEVSSNHQQDLGRCLRFIDVAAEIGCDAVKFQLFRVAELFSPEALAFKPSLHDRVKWELPESFVTAIAERCLERGIAFMCTPFYLEAVDVLAPHIAAFKVASYELMWDELLDRCARSGRPMMVSTGMATLEEIDHAVTVIRNAGCRDLTLLHCTSAYPTPLQDANLAAIGTLRKRYGCTVGWSDHTVVPAVVERAVLRWQATAVEFHLDLDGEGEEYATGHCWLPHEIGAVIDRLRLGRSADGNGAKVPVPSELLDREWRADPSDGMRPLVHVRRTLRPA